MDYRFKTLPVTYILLFLNIVVYIMLMLFGGSQNSAVLITFGANYAPLVISGQIWRLVTAMFLHAGLEHLVFNMMTLFLLGAYIEPLLGSGRFLAAYLLSGLGGGIFSFALNKGLSVGASTALFGLFGVYLMFGESFRQNPYIKMMARQFLILVVINLGLDLFDSSIDIWGHIGGLLAGFLSAYVLGVPKLGNVARHKRIISAAAFIIIYTIIFKIGFIN